MVHVYHQSTFGTNAAVLDTWFAEGFAEYISSGKSSKSKTEILNMVNTQNPIAVMTNSGTGNLTYYPAFQSSVAYLFDPSGAKNSLTMILAFMATLKTNHTNASLTCAAAGPCATFRQTAFTQTFEAHFKEADGSGMALRTGTNNLQNSIAQRLGAFL